MSDPIAVTAWASLVTAVVTLLTVVELRRQRVGQYRPELAVEDASFWIYRWYGSAGPGTTKVSYRAEMPPSEAFSDQRALRIQNIGFGAARGVTAACTFDALAFAEVLTPFDETIEGRVEQTSDWVRFVGRLSWMARRDTFERLGTVLPLAAANTHSVSIPSGYESLLALYFLALSLDLSNPKPKSWGLVPPLRLTLCYRDVAGAKHSQVIEVRPSVISVSGAQAHRPSSEWQDIGAGTFDVYDV